MMRVETAKTEDASGGAEPPSRRLVGYARISPDAHRTDTQVAELRAAGCDQIRQDHASGTSDNRPVLEKVLSELTEGETLVVTNLDRLGQSAANLLQLIVRLLARGIHFRSLHDPIDTATSQGMFALEVLGAIVRLDRSVTAERTRAGMKAAKAKGKLAGNPGLRDGLPEARAAISRAREKAYLDDLQSSSESWLPVVQQLRPQHSWENIALILNRRGQDWTVERLRRAVHRMVREKHADPELLARSSRRIPEDRLMKLVAAVAIADPTLSLRGIAAQLDKMGEVPARGGRKWQPSSVRHFLDEAHRFGLLPR
ncbi:recombinase family protein [Rhizobium grahamii]